MSAVGTCPSLQLGFSISEAHLRGGGGFLFHSHGLYAFVCLCEHVALEAGLFRFREQLH